MTARILVASDDSCTRILLEYNLARRGHRVTVVENGKEVEQQIERISPNLLVLDWQLLGTSGLELCRRLRSDQSVKQIPILMLARFRSRADCDFAIRIGADAVLEKPFSLRELNACIDRLFEEKQCAMRALEETKLAD